MTAIDIIRKKRDGRSLSAEEIAFLVGGASDGSIPDYQLAAFLMAVYLRGMDGGETGALTEAMMRSGDVLDFSDVEGPKADKHSTGGVGDKTSLILAPIAAAAGVKVPMISGRGLGHTGGTLDKLEAIPGFRTGLTNAEIKACLETGGFCIAGQTAKLVPADRKLYALRDVTATVESIPLITASIMSKKLAEGIDALVLDVKTGQGAFMREIEDARRLAQGMADAGKRMGKQVSCFLTDMNQPLGRMAGNALEVAESIQTLRGEGPRDLEELSVKLAAEIIFLAGLVPNRNAARVNARAQLTSGRALERFAKTVEMQGGDPRVVDRPDLLPAARERKTLTARRGGWIVALDAHAVGTAVVALGGGRLRSEDAVDPAVGVVLERKAGEEVREGDVLATVHANDRGKLDEAVRSLAAAYTVSDAKPKHIPLIIEYLRP